MSRVHAIHFDRETTAYIKNLWKKPRKKPSKPRVVVPRVKSGEQFYERFARAISFCGVDTLARISGLSVRTIQSVLLGRKIHPVTIDRLKDALVTANQLDLPGTIAAFGGKR